MKDFRAVGLILFFFLIQTIAASAQASVSPYGRYGPGDLSINNQPVIESMGGSSAAFSDSGVINLQQPASLTSLGSGLVILEAGFFSALGNYQLGNQQNRGTNAGFGYLALAIPMVKNRWTAALNLSPYSAAGYTLRDTLIMAGNTPVEQQNNGSGGFSSLGFSNAIRLSKNLSIGLTVNYLFGRMDYSAEARFTEDPNIRSSSTVKTIWLNGLDYTGGLLAQHRFRRAFNWERDSLGNKSGRKLFSGLDSLHLIGGIRVSPTVDVQGRQGLLATTFLGNLQEPDTVLFNDRQKGSILLPMRVGASLALKNSHDKWLIMTDFSYTDWNRFRKFGDRDSVRSSFRISAGFQYHPRPENFGAGARNYFQKIRYRAGAFYSDGYLKPYGEAIPELGFSIGFGLPFVWKTYYANRSATHTLNIALTASQRGLSNGASLKEQIFRLSVGIAFNDRWFHKRQYE